MNKIMSEKPDFLTKQQYEALVEFKQIFGKEWKHYIDEFNNGRPTSEGIHLMGPIRQIRNLYLPGVSEEEVYMVSEGNGPYKHALEKQREEE